MTAVPASDEASRSRLARLAVGLPQDRTSRYVRFMCCEGSQDLRLFALWYFVVIKGVGEHRGDSVELSSGELEIAVRVAQGFTRVFIWSTRYRAKPQCSRELESRQSRTSFPFVPFLYE